MTNAMDHLLPAHGVSYCYLTKLLRAANIRVDCVPCGCRCCAYKRFAVFHFPELHIATVPLDLWNSLMDTWLLVNIFMNVSFYFLAEHFFIPIVAGKDA